MRRCSLKKNINAGHFFPRARVTLNRVSIFLALVSKNHISPLSMQDLFTDKLNHYDLRKSRQWEMYNVRTVKYGTETIRYMGPKTWEIVPKEIKDSETLREFKKKIRTWKPVGCRCRLCKTYIAQIGFI